MNLIQAQESSLISRQLAYSLINDSSFPFNPALINNRDDFNIGRVTEVGLSEYQKMVLLRNTNQLVVNFNLTLAGSQYSCIKVDATVQTDSSATKFGFYSGVTILPGSRRWYADYEVLLATDGDLFNGVFYGSNGFPASETIQSDYYMGALGAYQLGYWPSYYRAPLQGCIQISQEVDVVISSFTDICVFNSCYTDNTVNYCPDSSTFFGQICFTGFNTTTSTGEDTVNPGCFCPSSIPYIEGVPSGEPSFMPSVIVTSRPSSIPTSRPTRNPTNAPSTRPTASPTVRTVRPTVCPSMRPTSIPSAGSSAIPTTCPTSFPSFSPSSVPTAPTPVPSETPSITPSADPTSIPTDPDPTSVPTVTPTSNPSDTPQPTNVTPSPSSLPTCPPIPTKAPVIVPTHYPTHQKEPTMKPTHYPTHSKATTPTHKPTYCTCTCENVAPPTHSPTKSKAPTKPPTCKTCHKHI